jgi:hypothetical protein
VNNKTIFLGYPFRIPEIRAAVASATKEHTELICADNALTDLHLLDKIRNMMLEADLCLFDLTTHNVNVAVEYGFARGLRVAPLILYCDDERYQTESKMPDIFSDLRGIDSLRYKTFEELERSLRARLPLLLGTTIKPVSVDAPRLQMRLEARENQVNGTAFFVGDIFNAGGSPANRVKATLAGATMMLNQPARQPLRIGTLVPGETPRAVTFRYDDLSYVRNPSGMEHVLVEFCDDAAQRYEQRGRFLAWSKADGTYAYTFDGLGAPKPIESFTLPLQGLEMP